MFSRAIKLAARTSAVRPAVAGVPRMFSIQQPLRADIIQDLYLKELRAYKPAPAAANEKVDLVDKFSTPTPPPKPEIDVSAAAEGGVEQPESLEEESWPPLYNAIDDPHNYPDMWELRTEVDDGGLLPQRLKVRNL
ncbi:hypothetical protein HK101_004387 [Irineochytrium annulatum]|nr:hypothetical protein HK101_004387 [Irineochytrium annulatum]